MNEIDTSGPAFPALAGLSHITSQGMTLRDYFAAKAMHGFLANGSTDAGLMSHAAYIVADAMLKAREAK